MPAIKTETPDTFRSPQCLAPLSGSVPPTLTPMWARHHAFLGLQKVWSVPELQTWVDGGSGEPCIEVECGGNKALLYINRLCQGSRGPSIRHGTHWLTPNQFQFLSGRETAKDWKRSIRHKGKSLKTLLSKGILQVHPPICDCHGCRVSSPVNRGRLAQKRNIPPPPVRTPKKEPTSAFCSNRAGSDRADFKQEVELNSPLMRKSNGSDLIPVNSSLHRTSESRPNTDTQRKRPFLSDNSVGRRHTYSPSSSSRSSNNCLLESKKPCSESPTESSHTAGVEPCSHMTPEEHYQQMMSASNEPGSYEEQQQQQQQRLYQLASSMHVSSPADLLRVRPEGISIRTPGTVEVAGSSNQRRKQDLPQHRDAHVPERDVSHPPPLLSPQNAPHIALGSHLRPPFLGIPPALCQTPGYGFLQPAQAEIFARQQEMLRKQNLTRLEMSTELLRQKELEGLQRQRLLADPLGLPSGLPANHPALRSLQDLPERNPLRDEHSRHSAMLVLRHSAAPLLSLGNQGVTGKIPSKEDSSRKNSRKEVLGGLRSKAMDTQGENWMWEGDVDGSGDGPRDSESETEASDERLGGLSKADRNTFGSELNQRKDEGRLAEDEREPGEASGQLRTASSSVGTDSPSHTLFAPNISKNEAKYLPPTILPSLPTLPSFPTLPIPALPFGFPYSSPYLHAAGAVGGLFLDSEEAGPVEDISKWTVDEVCSFVDSMVGCSEYTQVFREQAIDGETLPLLTEEHLLNNMGLKLGPALKIRSQVARRAGRIIYMTSLPLTLPLLPSVLRFPERNVLQNETQPPSVCSTTSPGRSLPKQNHGSASSVAVYDGVKQAC